nr:putative ribonuclease H protein [Ipomoea batatas]
MDLLIENQKLVMENIQLKERIILIICSDCKMINDLHAQNFKLKQEVNEFLAGAGTDAPDVDEENVVSRPSMSYDDMWAKTLLETSEMEIRSRVEKALARRAHLVRGVGQLP